MHFVLVPNFSIIKFLFKMSTNKNLVKKITYIKKISFLDPTLLFNFVNFFFFCQFPKCRKNKQWVNPVIVLQDFSLSWNQSCRPFISSFSFPPPPADWCGLVTWMAFTHMCFSLGILNHNWWGIIFLFL